MLKLFFNFTVLALFTVILHSSLFAAVPIRSSSNNNRTPSNSQQMNLLKQFKGMNPAEAAGVMKELNSRNGRSEKKSKIDKGKSKSKSKSKNNKLNVASGTSSGAPTDTNEGLDNKNNTGGFALPALSRQEVGYLNRIIGNTDTRVKEDYQKAVLQFGYDLFNVVSAESESIEEGGGFLGMSGGDNYSSGGVPVTDNYIIGTGDEFTITLWGMVEGIYTVQVDRNGEITLPKAGVVSVAGLKYKEMSPFIRKQLSRFYSKFNLSISMGRLKSINLYVVGSVKKPGAYLLNPFSSVLDVLIEAGGPTKDGTLRNVQVIRNGKIITSVDLYDFLQGGLLGNGVGLASGDTIFVPLIGNTVAITGNVFRPAIYEQKETSDISDLLKLAGGALPTAYLKRAQVKRIKAHNWNLVLDIDISRADKKFPLKHMDIVTLFDIGDFNIDESVKNIVTLTGNVAMSGAYQLQKDFRVMDILKGNEKLLPDTLMDYAEIIRYKLPSLEQQVISFNLEKAIKGDLNHNLKLKDNDEIVIFGAENFRDRKIVTISGNVRNPGTYTLYSGITLIQLLNKAGGLTSDAMVSNGELYRTIDYDNQEVGRKLVRFSPANILSGKENIVLKSLDEIKIFGKSYFDDEQVIRILGEVRNPSSILNVSVLKGILITPPLDEQNVLPVNETLDELIDPCFEEINDPYIIDKEDDLATHSLIGVKSEVNKEDNGDESILNDPSISEKAMIAAATKNSSDSGIGIVSKNKNMHSEAGISTQSEEEMIKEQLEKGLPANVSSFRQRIRKVRKCPPSVEYRYHNGMRLSDLIRRAGGLTGEAFLERVEIHREFSSENSSYNAKVLTVNYQNVLAGQDEDILLSVRDMVIVYSKWNMKNMPRVYISGAVKNPGEVQLLEGMKIKDLVYRAGLDMSSYLFEAELTRSIVDNSTALVSVKRLSINIKKALRGDKSNNLLLKDGDRLLIKPINDLRHFKTVTLKGEFKFPGVYTIEKGERLSSVIRRAGDFSPTAYLKGAVFTRKSVMKREQQHLEKFKVEHEKRLTSLSASVSATGLQESDMRAMIADRENKKRELELLVSEKNLGRLVVDIKPVDVMESASSNFVLEDGDVLFIPDVPSGISVLGSVRNPVAFTFSDKFSAKSYVAMAGGFSKGADIKDAYILKVDGTSVVYDKNAMLDPGDTIIVPPSVEMKVRALPLWRDIMTIVGQFAVTITTLSLLF